MSDFGERKGELLEAIRASGPAGDENQAEKNLLNLAAVAWQEHRADGLKKLLDLLGAEGDEPIVDAWKSTVAEMESNLERWTDALGSGSSADWATTLVASVSPAEEHFVAELGEAVKVAEARDFIAAYVERVKYVGENLKAKWDAEMAERGVDKQQQQEAFKKIVEMLTKGFEEQRSLYEKAKEGLIDLVAGINDLPEITDGQTSPTMDAVNAGTGVDWGNTDSVVLMAGRTAACYRVYRDGVKAETDVLESMLNREFGSVIYLFTAFRAETQRWLDEFAFDKVEAKEEAASDALSTLVSNVSSSSANQRDAQEFADRARTALMDRFNVAKAGWEAFDREHHGRFVGPVTEEVRRALWDRDLFDREFVVFPASDDPIWKWESASRDLFHVDVRNVAADALERFRSSIVQELGDFKPEQVEEIKERLRKLIDEANAKREAELAK